MARTSWGEPGPPILTPDQRRLIRETRENAGLTRQALADLSGIAHMTITRLELGTTNLRPDMLRRMLAPLGLYVDLVVRPITARERRAANVPSGEEIEAAKKNGTPRRRRVWRREKKGAAR